MDAAIADELYDTGVNMGPAVASKFLQRWLSALNLQGKLYPDLDADGRIGPRTITALQAYLKHRGADGRTVMLRGLNSSQGARYLELAESRPANEAFLFGWMLNRVGSPHETVADFQPVAGPHDRAVRRYAGQRTAG